MAKFALFLIRIYQATLSPLFGNHCRFHPTCSDFASQAIGRYGFVRGAFLGLKRLLRCHPFHEGGLDPVP